MASFQAASCGHEFTSLRHWSAQLSAICQVRRGKSVLTQLNFQGPLNLKALLYPEAEHHGVLPAEAIVLHPPGGLVSGDELNLALSAEAGAHLVVTTPAATKVYGVDHHAVPQRQRVQLSADNAVLEYLPAETIIFDRAQAHLGLKVAVKGTGAFIGAETLVLGRKAGAYPFTQGTLCARTEITRDGRLLLCEQLQLQLPHAAAVLQSACGWAGATVLCTFYALGPCGQVPARDGSSQAAALNELALDLNRSGYDVTYVNEVFVGRLLTDSAAAAERWMLALWAQVRPLVAGVSARPLRIKSC